MGEGNSARTLKYNNMLQTEAVPTDLRVLSEQIYQYKKGVRNMVLYLTAISNKLYANLSAKVLIISFSL